MAKKTKRHSARTSDRHDLYQLAVQTTDADIAFIDRVYGRAFGRRPLTLREDFCGTALLCAAWVRSRPERFAFGVDLDPAVLDWGRAHNISPLGGAARRVHLHRGNVLHRKQVRVDVQVAFNFSWWVFKTRAELVRYFRAVRASIRRRAGLFLLDIHGGFDSFKNLKERRRHPGFTYIWEQASFNPLDARTRCHIHFDFPDGTRMRRAFTYDWRWWSCAETKEALLDAGFGRVEFYAEGTTKSGRGNGVYRLAERIDNDASYVNWIVAYPGPAP